jgi:hypothetical protein
MDLNVLSITKIILAFSTVAFVYLDARSEDLTGIVKQPTKPYDPAVDSTVTVYEKDGKKKIMPSDTTDGSGRYHFQIKKGTAVIVQATWKSNNSSPGRTSAVVEADPTFADVQLLPPINAPADDWGQAGLQWSQISGSIIHLGGLRDSGITAGSMFRFLKGVGGKEGFPELSDEQIFTAENTDTITSALDRAERQLKEKGKVPSREDFLVDFKTKLTDREYTEILGFIAPPTDSETHNQWKRAVIDINGSELKKNVMLEGDFFQNFFFPASDQKREYRAYYGTIIQD